MTTVLLRRGEHKDSDKHTEKVGYTKMELSCGKPAHARSLQMLKKTRKKSLLEALERVRHLDYRLLASRTVGE